MKMRVDGAAGRGVSESNHISVSEQSNHCKTENRHSQSWGEEKAGFEKACCILGNVGMLFVTLSLRGGTWIPRNCQLKSY